MVLYRYEGYKLYSILKYVLILVADGVPRTFGRDLFLAAVPDVDTEVIDKERRVSARKPIPSKQ